MTGHRNLGEPEIGGSCRPGFESVAEAFRRNFTEHGELGAACCVFLDGERVVDLWGGYRERARCRPWQPDTLCGFYSVGKGLAVLPVLQELEAGRLALDRPVADVWPEFAAAGKGDITVRQLLCHRAGLVAIRERLPEGVNLDHGYMASKLAAEPPWFEPGTRHVYQTNTYGYLLGELVRRTTGKSLGTIFRERIAQPLGADVYFGVREADLARCAELDWQPSGAAPDTSTLDLPMSEDKRMEMLSYMNPSGLSSLGMLNTDPWRRAEVPSTNGHGSARGIGLVYSVLAQGGEGHGVRIVGPEWLEEAARTQSEGWCPILKREVSFGLGFQPTRPDRPFGPDPGCYGHFGTGGSVGFADPHHRVGFGYVMNHIKPRWQGPRNRGLIDTFYRCMDSR